MTEQNRDLNLIRNLRGGIVTIRIGNAELCGTSSFDLSRFEESLKYLLSTEERYKHMLAYFLVTGMNPLKKSVFVASKLTADTIKWLKEIRGKRDKKEMSIRVEEGYIGENLGEIADFVLQMWRDKKEVSTNLYPILMKLNVNFLVRDNIRKATKQMEDEMSKMHIDETLASAPLAEDFLEEHQGQTSIEKLITYISVSLHSIEAETRAKGIVEPKLQRFIREDWGQEFMQRKERLSDYEKSRELKTLTKKLANIIRFSPSVIISANLLQVFLRFYNTQETY
uniref:Matrix protein n=1 Tax=Mason Creek virus TaxID=2651593 RepID=A0A5Q0TUP9_9VIRU|nr:matrix protein [Mason Creek virus]